MDRIAAIGLFALPLLLTILPAVRADDSPPATAKKPVTDTYHGVKVIDPYRWLENGDDPAVKKWSREQNKYARHYLDSQPDLTALRKQLTALNSAASADYFALTYRSGKLFALKMQPPKNQPFLITLKSADEPKSEQIIVDPNKINAKGTTALDFYVPSLDGQRVAVSLSEGGSEEGTVHVYETKTGKELSDVIPRVNGGTAGGSVTWNADGSGFWYTRYPRGSERPKEDLNFYQQIYFHKLGTATTEDTYALGKDFPRIAEIQLRTSPDGKHILALVANGDGGEFAHYLLGPSGKWVQLTHFDDKITGAAFGQDQALYLLSRNGTPRGQILRLPLANPNLKEAKTIVKESEAAIQGFVATDNRLYVADLVGGPSQVRVFDLEGKAQKPVPVPAISSVAQVVRIKDDVVLFRGETYLQPPAWYRFDPANGKAIKTALFRTSPADFSDYEVTRDFAVSKDGTKVPLNIIHKKGLKLNGTNPTILYGYGGYGVSLSPRFRVGRKVWLEQGGVYVVGNLRGGGEYGEAWHRAGNLTNKQNVFDDFIACANYLIEHKYTNTKKLAIEGGSNGGLLMGAALTQHPSLFRAVVCHVGVLDMLRVELHPNGAFNVTEYGTVKDRKQFEALVAYSPYHRVKEGTAYPAVLFLTGENDPRVDPANSRKMTARVQAATSSRLPVLLRVSFDSGHGIGTSLRERIAQESDVYAFLFAQLGMKYKN
ncbi:MAG TPA: prolyl oligopeptidase family serine peptidase [Gemmataceae bacterium]|nr:prolyl oligopeptidase family serine peptidase [Gemmataceae bacterium]